MTGDTRPPSIARIMVDVAAAAGDSLFDYTIPDRMADEVQAGRWVKVPFGPRTVEGIVTGLARESSVPPDRLRPVSAVSPAEPLPPELIELAHWVADRYMCHPVQALRVMLPPGARRAAVKPKFVRVVKRTLGADETLAAARQLEKRAPRQAELLRLLAAADGGGEGVRPADLVPGGDFPYASLAALIKKGLVEEGMVPDRRDPWARVDKVGAGAHPLTPHQQRCLDPVAAALASGEHGAFLLDGVTGSGKTEVYLHAIQACVGGGRTAICLVPEISLTPQLVGRFRAALGSGVAVLHSGLSAGERYDEWCRIARGEAPVVVGARSAVFAPLQNIGLIIIDEEHEPAYKQDEAPRYHARPVAEERARRWGAVLLCGSATPSLDSRARADRGEWGRLRLPRRIDDRPMPRVVPVDLRSEFKEGHKSLFSRPLTEAIEQCLDRGEQAILFLNRRGFATVVLCRECGYAVKCPHCAVSLTYHQAGMRRPGGSLICHYCHYEGEPPLKCPECGGLDISFFGAGTERVESAARELFPEARILRMDSGTMTRKDSYRRAYRAFVSGEIDILIGTQMIAKGWDVPGVTVVGVISADTALHLPDFRSSERTHQLLVQVAGRAGRGDKPGTVFIQTFDPDHPAIAAACTGDGESFYAAELDMRRAAGFPPFGRLIRIVADGPSEGPVERAVTELAAGLREGAPPGVQVLGPAPAALARLRGRHRWHLLIKGPRGGELRDHVARVRDGVEIPEEVRAAVDVDPVSML